MKLEGHHFRLCEPRKRPFPPAKLFYDGFASQLRLRAVIASHMAENGAPATSGSGVSLRYM
eukprot:3596277-Prymnesium_polylepis.2